MPPERVGSVWLCVVHMMQHGRSDVGPRRKDSGVRVVGGEREGGEKRRQWLHGCR